MHCVRAIDAVMVRIGTGLRRKCVNISRDGADQIYVNHRQHAGGWARGRRLFEAVTTSDSLVKATNNITVTSLL